MNTNPIIRTAEGPINTYKTSVIRPFDSVAMPNALVNGKPEIINKLPSAISNAISAQGALINSQTARNQGIFKQDNNQTRDIKRSTFYNEADDPDITFCNTPCSYASNYQQWVSEDNAIKYHAMRPILQPDQYNDLLKKMFNMIVMQQSLQSGNNFQQGNSTAELNKVLNVNDWSKTSEIKDNRLRIFCEVTQENVMKYIMDKVDRTVVQIPEFTKNSSYKYEIFSFVDPEMYQFDKYFKVIFMLHNYLRSVTTLVYVIFKINNSASAGNNNYTIIYMDFVDNQGVWKSNGADMVNGILPSNQGSQIDSESYYDRPVPSVVEWNVANSLIKNQFNKFGYYEDGSNIVVNASMSDKMRQNVKNYEDNAKSYLLPCTSYGFNGQKINNDGSVSITNPLKNNTNKAVYNNMAVVYNVNPDHSIKYKESISK